LWNDLKNDLSPRIYSYTRNISLLRISAEDARVNKKLLDNRNDEDDSIDFDHNDEHIDIDDEDDSTPTFKQNMDAVLETLQRAAKTDELPSMKRIVTELITDVKETVSMGEENLIDIPTDFDRDMDLDECNKLLSNDTSIEDMKSICRSQARLNSKILSCIDGSDKIERATSVDGPVEGRADGSSDAEITINLAPYKTYTELASNVSLTLTLNDLQQMVLLQVARFMDNKRDAMDEKAQKEQFLEYVGGAGGTGKSRIIEAIKELFRLRDEAHLVIITASSGSAASKVEGITIHSACKLSVDDSGRRLNKNNISQEYRWRWKQKLVLIIDEISMIGGSTFSDIDERMRIYREDERPFGGIPIVLLSGDFFQFGPIKETNLLLGASDTNWIPTNSRHINRLEKHLKGHKLLKLFKNVIVLEEQVRAKGCPILSGFLERLRKGEQTEEDFDMLKSKFSSENNFSFKEGLRAITPLNLDRWTLNVIATLEWAKSKSKNVSFFVSKHTWEYNTLTLKEKLSLIQRGDDSSTVIPGIFVCAIGMPIILTKNVLPGLKMVNGAEFDIVDIILDPKYPGIPVSDDVTIYTGPPKALILQSQQIKSIEIDGLPPGVVVLKGDQSDTINVKSSLYGNVKCRRVGLTCTPAFVMTDYKSQSRTFENLLLDLKGRMVTTSGPSKCDPISLYVQISRATTWEGFKIRSQLRRKDFIEPKNVIDEKLRKRILELEKLSRITMNAFRDDHLTSRL
jgi:PIF1-like helicase